MGKISWSAIKADFNLDSITEVYFWKSEWETFDPHDYGHHGSSPSRVSCLYLLFRFIYMAVLIAAHIENFACDDDIHNDFYWIFLTNQTFFAQLIYSIIYFLYILWVFWKQRHASSEYSLEKEVSVLTFHDEYYRLPVICKIIWIFINMLNVIPYVVTAIYWTILFRDQKYEIPCQAVDDILVHGLNSPLALLDSLVIGVPIRRTHALFPVCFAIYYSTFSGLYELFGGEYTDGRDYIYPILNWKHEPGFAALTCIGCTVGAVFLHWIFCWGVYRLRIFMKAKYFTQTSGFMRQ